MKKNLKILICMVLCLGLLISNSAILFATGNKAIDDPTETTISSDEMRKYSKDTGIPLSELKEILDKPGVDIAQFITDYTAATDFSDVAINSGGSGGSKMTKAQFNYLISKSLKGNILLSADQTHYGVNHGHAGIVTTQGSRTVEALGPGILSKECIMSGWWSEMYTAKLFYHKTCTNNQQLNAANYAYNNLRGKTYKAIPKVTESKLNCATLVWQAYKSQGITLNKVWLIGVGDTCFPKQLLQDTSLSCKVNINW